MNTRYTATGACAIRIHRRIGDVRFGSIAVDQTDSNRMTALGWKAARTSPFTDTGRSEALKMPELNGSQKQSFRLLTLSIGRFEYSDDQLPVAETEKKEADKTSERKQ